MRSVWLAGLLVLAACAENRRSDQFSFGKECGTIDRKLEEASGLVTSAAHPGYLWTHNDSGNGADLYLIDSAARIVAIMPLAQVHNRDWEDIALGPGPEHTKSYLYIGDIGDNNAQYAFKIIYRVAEPTTIASQPIATIDTLYVRLPDGPRDAEALMVDPLTSDLFVISKREDSVRLYQVPDNWQSGDTLTAELKARLPYFNTVAADISADGTEVLLKTYEHVYYWKRQGSEALVNLLQQPPLLLNYKREKQGEAVAWARDGTGYYTLSESNTHERARLMFYKRK
ncbi:MAG: hypothetical protein J0L66_05945 [Cytophagales bacterium]|nr:hypothetical protein [Cytophagales bacterium]